MERPTPRPAASAFAAASLMLLGAIVLLGWLVDVPSLRTFFGLSNAMAPSTAAGFVLCGTALWLVRREPVNPTRRAVAAAAGVCTAAIGALWLGSYAFGLDLGLDQTFGVRDPGAFPGQMAIPTALSFVLAGAALAIVDVETRRGWRPAQTLTLISLLFPLLGLVGPLYGVPIFERFLGGTVVMALHTSLGFFILASGIMRARPRHGLMRLFTDGGKAGTLLRLLVPAMILCLIAAGWLRIVGERAGLFGAEFGTAGFVVFAVALLTGLIIFTARRLYRMELGNRAAAERQASLLESMGEAVVITDVDGSITAFNPAFERLTGLAAEDLLGRPHEGAIALVGRDGEPMGHEDRYLPRALASGRTVSSVGFEVSLLRRDGSSVPVSVTAAPIRGAEGEIVGGVDVLRDVSQEREVDELKSSLISTVSHELRTPLTMIQGFSELLLDRAQGDEQVRYALGQIFGSSQRLSRLIADLLSVSSIDSGTLAIRPEPVLLEDALRDALAPFGADSQLSLEVAGAPTVVADRDKLLQIVTNLVSNALKYSQGGEPVTVSAATSDGMAEISVRDRGIGMSPAELARLFEKFFRADRSEVRATSGTGLGLFITRSLVEMHGGTIRVESAVDRGTTFTFTLPLASESEPAVERSA